MPMASACRSINSSRTPCMETRLNAAFTVVISAAISYSPPRRMRSSAMPESLPPLQNATAFLILINSGALAQEDVHRAFARDVACALISQCTRINLAPEMLSGPEQNRADDEVQLVDQPCSKILPNRRYTAPQANVAPGRRRGRLFQGGMYAIGNEAKLGAAGHFK